MAPARSSGSGSTAGDRGGRLSRPRPGRIAPDDGGPVIPDALPRSARRTHARSFQEVAIVERPETRPESLPDNASEPITSIDELRETCLPTLTARIWETCCWPERMSDGRKVGDFNFIVIEYPPAGDDRA